MAIQKKSFDFDALRDKHSTTTKYKPERYLHCGDAFLEASGLPGPAIGHINMFLGHTDTGKTTAMVKAAASAQKMNILPVFLISEQKWSFEHAKLLGLDCEQDANGEWKGFFFFRDGFNYIEQLTDYINGLLDLQVKGELPYDLAFFWDSVGSIPSKLTFNGGGGKQHTAGVLAEKIGMGLNQRITSSRKEGMPYTNTMVICNQPWVRLADNPFSQAKIKAKGGEAIWLNATLVFLFGNQQEAGISKIDAQRSGRKVLYATRTKITIMKNHINGLGFADSRLIATPHGFIQDSKESIDKYKKEMAEYWDTMLVGEGEIVIIDPDESEEESQ